MRKIESAADIDDAAARWVAKMASASLTMRERRMFDGWISQSDRHAGAYARARAVWASLGPQHEDEFHSEGDVNTREVAVSAAACGWERPVVSRRAVMAAGLIAALTGSTALYWRFSDTTQIVTGVGEQRRLLLGSAGTVMMNTQSSLAMTCARQSTCDSIELTRGEALFSVKQSNIHPLTVDCPNLTLRCVDAVFSLAVDGYESRVTVARGMVHLVRNRMKDLVLASGSQAIVARGAASVRKISQEAVDRSIAWTTGYLVFAGETLADAVADFNRYNQLEIALGSGVPAQDPVVGRFSINDPKAFATAVAQIYALSLSTDGNLLVLTRDVAR